MREVPYPAPKFTLPESVSGELRSLDDYKGKWLVLYFYPKDDTPGCTTEACSMRDARDALTDLGAEVIGISKDEPELHEKFKVKYNLNDAGEMTVTNPTEIEALYRFPDLTNHAVFLTRAIQSTINKDVPEELLFLQCYDELKVDIQKIVDMPDNKVDRMILFLHQNGGKLAHRKRGFYKELNDTEIEQMEQAYSQIFARKENE